MQKARVFGKPERVFEAIRTRLTERGIEPRLVDPASITLLFDLDATEKGAASTFFLCVVPAGDGESDVALARRRARQSDNVKAMVLGKEDPVESRVLKELVVGVGSPGSRIPKDRGGQ